MNKAQWYGKDRGIYESGGTGTISFEILSSTDQASIDQDKANFENLIKYGESFSLDGFTVATNGENNNLPGETKELVKFNPFLPEVLKKQARIIYGQGPMLYVVEYDDKKQKVRKPVDDQYPEFFNWLKSWKQSGLPSFQEYFKKTILNYYYSEEYYSGWHFNKSRRINGELPIRGLESLSPVKCRKALKGALETGKTITDELLKYIIVGKWNELFRKEFEVFNRLDPTDALKYHYAINYTADFGFDEDIYSTPTYFFGLREWIKGSNLNPKYINSYLKNSLNAKLHVIIPDAWLKQKQTVLEKICKNNMENAQNADAQISEYDGLTGIGSVFNYTMLTKLVDIKLQQVANVLSGTGENQGKTFWSRSFKTEHGLEQWEFKDIPTKYKEFVTSIIEFNKEATAMIVAGKGLPPSISNLSKDGIFTSSGSESYYNYILYLESLPYPEEIICEEINMAAHINFPKMAKNNVMVGFYRHKPERIEETPPSNRIENNPK